MSLEVALKVRVKVGARDEINVYEDSIGCVRVRQCDVPQVVYGVQSLYETKMNHAIRCGGKKSANLLSLVLSTQAPLRNIEVGDGV